MAPFARTRAVGTPASPSARGPMLLGWSCLILLLGGLGIWSVRAELAGAVIAPGQVVVSQNRQIIQHPDGGIIAEIAVEEGDVVVEGQLLIRLDGATLRSEASVLEGRLLELWARRAGYEAEERDVEILTFPEALRTATSPFAEELMVSAQQLWNMRRTTEEQEVDQLHRRQDQLSEQGRGLEAQERAVAAQIEIASRELSTQRQLQSRGLAASARVLELEREEAALRGEAGQLEASRAEADSRVTEIGIEILRLRSTRQEEAATMLRDLEVQEIELAERLSELRIRIARLDIRAPVEGIIYGSDIFALRSVVGAGESLLQIVPQTRPLVINAQVAAIDINEVHVGQQVVVRFPGLDGNSAPDVEGRIDQISADSYSLEGGAGAFYRAVVTLVTDTDALVGRDLLPGMPVETYISTGSRTPAAYLLAPLSDHLRRSFRES